MNLADNLKKIRKEHNLSQEQLAEKLGVSRQSVSKWESNLAYPEMDKVLQLCKLFNLNIDELLNQDIKEVNDNKQAKININKYIDDFLEYVTKTLDMFTSITFKEKIKCLLEQFIIICIMFFLFYFVGGVFSSIIYRFVFLLPNSIANFIFEILCDIYLIICFVLGSGLVFHIFKVRYLDYYTIIKENMTEEKDIQDLADDNQEKHGKIVYQNKQPKVIIRDPNHASYKFIDGLLKCFLVGIKMCVAFAAFICCCSIICLVIALVLSFLFVKTGMTFFGALLILLASIIIHLVVLIILYHFIISKKNQKKRLAIIFVISLFVFGIGTGLMFISFTKYDVIENLSSDNYIETEKVIPMTENLFIQDQYFDVEYVETPRDDLRIVISHANYWNIDVSNHNESIMFHYKTSDYNQMDMVRQVIADINEKKIVDYSNYKITIYASKENIDRLEYNRINYYQRQEEIEREKLYNEINELNEKIREKDAKISDLELELELYRDNQE